MSRLLRVLFLAALAIGTTFAHPSLAASAHSDGENGIGLAIGDAVTGGITYYRKLDEKTFIESL